MNKMIVATLVLLVSVQAHANFLEKVNNALGTVNRVFGGNASATTSTQTANNFATPTDTQLQRIATLLMQPTNNANLDSVIVQAKNNISQILLLGGCATTFNFGAGAVQSPQAYSHAITSAIASTNYHPKSQCMTVQNLGSWEQPARNSLRFKVVYASDVSGETVTRTVEMLDEYGNGNWLVKKHDIY